MRKRVCVCVCLCVNEIIKWKTRKDAKLWKQIKLVKYAFHLHHHHHHLLILHRFLTSSLVRLSKKWMNYAYYVRWIIYTFYYSFSSFFKYAILASFSAAVAFLSLALARSLFLSFLLFSKLSRQYFVFSLFRLLLFYLAFVSLLSCLPCFKFSIFFSLFQQRQLVYSQDIYIFESPASIRIHVRNYQVSTHKKTLVWLLHFSTLVRCCVLSWVEWPLNVIIETNFDSLLFTL